MDNLTKAMSIKAGFNTAKLITKQHAKTFYFASRFLPKNKQYAAYSVYAICRISDDSVDDKGSLKDVPNLNNIRQRIKAAYENKKLDDKLLQAFQETINKYNIPKRFFDELIEGIDMDLDKNIYQNFNELYTYCYRVAGVIGLIMLKIFGYINERAEKYAVDLGIAMQLTNILRDIKEDYLKGRIYLPQDELRKFGVSENQIAAEKMDSNFISLLKFQIERARQYYKNSTRGIKMIDNLKSRIVVCMMKDMYSAILNSIENNDYNVFSRRACVNALGKTAIAFKILVKTEYL